MSICSPASPSSETVGGQPGDGDVEVVAPEQREDLGRAALAHVHADARVRRVEARQQLGQVHRPRRQHRAERDRPLEQAR